jgi:subtilase family serine protease
MGSSSEIGPIPAGGSYWRTNLLSLPVTQSGTYYLVLKTDDQGNLLESDQNNNVVIVPVSFQLSLSDLAPLALQAPQVLTNSAYPFVTLVTGVTNQGPDSAQTSRGAWSDYTFLSKNPVLDGTETFVSYSGETGP